MGALFSAALLSYIRAVKRLFVLSFALLAVLACFADSARAFQIGLPMDCAGADICFIQNYFDRDPGPGARDYTCGSLTYNGHEGTDFRISYADVARGVPVLAVADGVVRAVRDGEPEGDISLRGKDSVRGREAGNGVAVVHGDGYETQYSHLKQGSVRVRPGERVRAGQVLGLAGESGLADFPHLEMVVRHNGKAFCPFAGEQTAPGCGVPATPAWTAEALAAPALTYRATGLLRAGFVAAPSRSVNGFLRREVLGAHGGDPQALIFAVALFGARAGDRFSMRLLGPDGAVLAQIEREMDRTLAQAMEYLGKRRSGPWPAGLYRGEYVLCRTGPSGQTEVLRAEASVTLP